MPQLFLRRKNHVVQETWNGTGKSSVSSLIRMLIRPKCIYFPKHFCYCLSSNLCVLNATNAD
jgi:hypothetical protein